MKTKNKLFFLTTLIGFIALLTACELGENVSHGALNEWLEVGNWEVKLIQIEIADHFDLEDDAGRALIPRSGHQFVFLYLAFQNNDDLARTFAPHPPTFNSRTEALNIDMEIGEARRWLPSDLTLYENGWFQDRFDILRSEVGSGEEISGIVAFEINTSILNDSDRPLILHFSNDGEDLTFDLRALYE